MSSEPKKRQAGMAFIFATVVLDMLGLGVVIPSLPEVVRRLVSDPLLVPKVYGWFIAIYPCMQFFASPILGAISDRYGRRPVLLVSLFSAGCNYLVMAFAPTLGLLFMGRGLAGLSGASVAVASAYVADISTAENRSKNFGLMGAAVGLGFILGPVLGGYLGHTSFSAPFVAAAILNFVNFGFGLLTLPESLRHRNTEKRFSFNPFAVLIRLFKQPKLKVLLTSYFLFSFAGQTHPSLWSLYTRTRFSWGLREVGGSLALVGVTAALSQAWLTRVFSRRWSDRQIATVGLMGQGVGYAVFGLANEGWMILVILVATGPFWTAGPAFQSILAQGVSAEDQGELQGGLMSLNSLVSVFNPIVMTALFGVFTPYSTPYLLAGILCLMAVVVLRRGLASQTV